LTALQQLPRIVPVLGPNTILPVQNPTGNPYANSSMKKLPELTMLKGL